MTPVATSLIGGVAALERAMAYTFGALQHVGPYDLSRPTPCTAWMLGDLLAHMDDSLRTLHDAVVTGRLGLGTDPEPPGDFGDLPPVDALRARGCAMVGAWAAARTESLGVGDREVTAPVVAATGALEVSVHGWDVYQAVGRPTRLPEALADELLDLVPLLVSAADRPHRFAAEVPTGSSHPGDRLVAALGRVP